MNVSDDKLLLRQCYDCATFCPSVENSMRFKREKTQLRHICVTGRRGKLHPEIKHFIGVVFLSLLALYVKFQSFKFYKMLKEMSRNANDFQDYNL